MLEPKISASIIATFLDAFFRAYAKLIVRLDLPHPPLSPAIRIILVEDDAIFAIVLASSN